jgi:hypothetical protein
VEARFPKPAGFQFSRPLADSQWATATIEKAVMHPPTMLALIVCLVILAGITMLAGLY